jgi:hypothetical protein
LWRTIEHSRVFADRKRWNIDLHALWPPMNETMSLLSHRVPVGREALFLFWLPQSWCRRDLAKFLANIATVTLVISNFLLAAAPKGYCGGQHPARRGEAGSAAGKQAGQRRSFD